MISRAAVIIPAAGFGTRMNLDHPKQYHLLAGRPILVHTVRAFCERGLYNTHRRCCASRTGGTYSSPSFWPWTLWKSADNSCRWARRQDSVKAGLDTLDDTTEIVLVHDAARPLVNRQLIIRCYEAAIINGAAIAAVPVKDTLKKGNTLDQVIETIDRTDLWQAQTPQAARRELLERAYRINGDADVTDESSLLEKAAIPVTLVEGAETNIKITRPEDLFLAEKLLNHNCDTKLSHRARLRCPSFCRKSPSGSWRYHYPA